MDKKYHNVCNHNEIKSGDLIAWTTVNSFFLKAVRLFTLSEYTHVGIAIVEDDGSIYVIEANRPTVEKNLLDKRLPAYHVPMKVNMNKEAIQLLHSYIGKKYSVLQAALSYINIYIDDDKWYCTELAYDFYIKQGYDVRKRLTPTKFIKEAVYNYGKELNYIESIR